MGLFLINVLGWIAVASIVLGLLGMLYRCAPHEAKLALSRRLIVSAWEGLLHLTATTSHAALAIAKTHRNIPDNVLDGIEDYVRECLELRTGEAFEDIELPEGFYISAMRFKNASDKITLVFDVKRDSKKYIVKPGLFSEEKIIPISD